MKFKALFLSLVAIAITSCSQDTDHGAKNGVPPQGIMVKDWEVGCQVERQTYEKTCYMQRRRPEFLNCTRCTTFSIITVQYNRSKGLSFDFGQNDNPESPATIQIADNPPINYTGEVISGATAQTLFKEFSRGGIGHVTTEEWGGQSHEFSFDGVGFKRAYRKMMEFYNEKPAAGSKHLAE